MDGEFNIVLNWRSTMLVMALLPMLIGIVTLLLSKVERRASITLAAFFLCIAFGAGPQIIGYAGFYDQWPGLTYFPLFYVSLWFGPLLYLHGYTLMKSGAVGWRKYLLVPGILQFFYYLWAFFGIGEGWQDYEAKWAYNGAVHQPFIAPFTSVLGLGLLIFALVAVWRMMKAYNQYLENTQSQAVDFDPVWLRRIILGALIGGFIYLAGEIAALFNPSDFKLFFLFQLSVLLITAWLAVEAVFRLNRDFPKMGTKAPKELALEKTDEPNHMALAEKIREKTVSEKWFLESQISIRDVARRLGTNESYISRALNQEIGQSFNQFINTLRVDHAKSLIRVGSLSMIEVALDSGFNSKATFNRVFRAIAGQTPSAFKTSQKT